MYGVSVAHARYSPSYEKESELIDVLEGGSQSSEPYWDKTIRLLSSRYAFDAEPLMQIKKVDDWIWTTCYKISIPEDQKQLSAM